jgi:hypothetical protein
MTGSEAGPTNQGIDSRLLLSVVPGKGWESVLQKLLTDLASLISTLLATFENSLPGASIPTEE